MIKALVERLHDYIRENNPDVLLQLEEDGQVAQYLSDKLSTVNTLVKFAHQSEPAYIIEDMCWDILTQDLKPSKFNYIKNLLEEEFVPVYEQLLASGILKFEVINLISRCQPVFDDLNFSEENEDNRFLRYAIMGTISEYFKSVISEDENVKDGLQQPTKTEG